MLPVGLRTALESGTCVLFLGSGVGYEAFDSAGGHAPDARDLAKKLASRFSISTSDPDLAKIAAVVELRRGRPELDKFLREELAKYEPSDAFRWLFSLTWRAIFTTNYDRWIERCYETVPNPTQRPVVVSDNADLARVDPRVDVPIYHLHGSLSHPTRPFALITDQDYARYSEHRRMLFELLKLHYATGPILYVGYSNTDSDWRLVLRQAREKERLWLLSASVSDWLGDRPVALDALRRAVEAAPNGRLARYLLAEFQLRSNSVQEAHDTLEPLIEAEPDNYRACLLAALIRYRLGRPLQESIAVMGLATLSGLRDGRFLATYGGFLSLAGQKDEAERVFGLGRKLNLRFDQLNRVEFVPFEHDAPMRWRVLWPRYFPHTLSWQ